MASGENFNESYLTELNEFSKSLMTPNESDRSLSESEQVLWGNANTRMF